MAGGRKLGWIFRLPAPVCCFTANNRSAWWRANSTGLSPGRCAGWLLLEERMCCERSEGRPAVSSTFKPCWISTSWKHVCCPDGGAGLEWAGSQLTMGHSRRARQRLGPEHYPNTPMLSLCEGGQLGLLLGSDPLQQHLAALAFPCFCPRAFPS